MVFYTVCVYVFIKLTFFQSWFNSFLSAMIYPKDTQTHTKLLSITHKRQSTSSSSLLYFTDLTSEVVLSINKIAHYCFDH